MTNPIQAVIFGCEGLELSDAERAFYRNANPLGLILFGRNCRDPKQVSALVQDFRDCLGRLDAPVLIDQEGGRVTRLKAPHWQVYPAARTFGDLTKTDRGRALEAMRLAYGLIGHDLRTLGITVDCAPTIDVPTEGAHEMIGNRAFSTDPAIVVELGRAACETLLSANVIPVIKHLPGYGRAHVDSHEALPIIEVPLKTLDETDLVPFRTMADMPWGMTAHAVLLAVDPIHPVSVSAKAIADIIRDRIGFHGVLVTDDLGMNALTGPIEQRVRRALDAGCDIALHCNGKLEEMETIAAHIKPLSDDAQGKLNAAESLRRASESWRSFDVAEARYRLDELLHSPR